MKQGYVIKGMEKEISAKDMELINKYTMRKLKPNEVYTFKVVLCDNDIDRDFECFSVKALNQMKELFVGKTGVFDHNPKAGNQAARIYDCFVEDVDGKKTETGEDYVRLIAKAYLPRSEKNEDFILNLDSGIQKEVSVGCSVSKSICSICGQQKGGGICSHQKGKKYDGELCYFVLDEIADAYEWSFVAVPAQRKAGVIKAYEIKTEVNSVQDIKKALKAGNDLSLTKEQSDKLYNYIEELEKYAEFGKAYREELKNDVARLMLLQNIDIPKKAMLCVADKMTIEELKAFKKGFEEKENGCFIQKPQLYTAGQGSNLSENDNYKL
ncbi:MAG: hypothetical protein ACI4I4_04430 [Acutalibacteraceae bacterium]